MGELRRIPARKADIDRAIKSVRDAGYDVASVEIGSDGSVKVLTGPALAAQRDELTEWRARRDARKAAGSQ